MRYLILTVLIFFAVGAQAREFESPMTMYKNNYFICGDSEQDQA